MSRILFSEINLSPLIFQGISKMGFEYATPVQSEAIPLIRTGVDVIARSQTGTGKTVAFAIPALEQVDTRETKGAPQVLVLCPTRELAQQATEEIQKVARFMEGIHPVAVYGGTAMDKQCIRLRRANIVIGTPGRIMDHLRRKTMKLSHLKMVVLDEADEMLNMGFKEDIETILLDAPANRQTVLFSATMPPAIMALTKEFQKDPQLVEIDKEQRTLSGIRQSYVEVAHRQKKEALVALMKYHQPNRSIIFCNTKKMVDELSEMLGELKFSTQSIHSDIKQSQRTSVMNGFKSGRTSILIATDIAARGIDVSDVDFVINFDIPANAEYYIHRIGRTGRAGKSGRSITLCGGRRDAGFMRSMAAATKSEIERETLPTAGEIRQINRNKQLDIMEELLQGEPMADFSHLVDQLVERGYPLRDIAQAALQLQFQKEVVADDVAEFQRHQDTRKEPDRKAAPGKRKQGDSLRVKPAGYEMILIDAGSSHRIAVNHIIGTIADRTELTGKDIGRVEIFPHQSVVEIPRGRSQDVLQDLSGCKINGRSVRAVQLAEPVDLPRKTKKPQYPKNKKRYANYR